MPETMMTSSSAQPRTMSMEDKLEYFDREIKLIHDFCLKSGYNPRETEKAASPFVLSMKSSERQKWKLSAWTVGILGLIAAATFYYDPAFKLICAAGRQTTIQLLPIWDWTRIYNMECVIENPYFVGNVPSEDDCEICENLESIERIYNTSAREIADSYMKRDIPVIVEDGMKDWPEAKQDLTIEDLIEEQMTNEGLSRSLSCNFKSNIKVRNGNQKKFLKDVSQGTVMSYYAHWENCLPEAAKESRVFYQRPYFLPSMVEIADANWIFLSSNYKGKKSKPMPMDHSLVMFMQLEGETTIILLPRNPCNETCKPVTSVLQQGQIAMWTDFLWDAAYIPSEEDNFAVAVGGSFD